MTKKIIIDGIDVSKCEFLQCGNCEATRDVYGDSSYECKDDDMENCHYKQLKRKEQECDDYKIANAELEKENEELLNFKEMQEKELFGLRTRLEEIDKKINEICSVCVAEDTKDCNSDCYIFDVLNIINKAREE